MQQQLLLVFLGGGLGSCLRFFISKVSNSYFQHVYLGTFMVNILGCLIMGFLFGLTLRGNYLSQNQSLLLATGFCGGFTTFSAFALENHVLLKAGHLFQFSAYSIGSILFGILAIGLGFWIAKIL